MGDVAQLPPVMQTESPALNPRMLRGYNLHSLGDSVNSSRTPKRGLRNPVQRNPATRRTTKPHGRDLLKLQFKGFSGAREQMGDELIEEISSAYSSDGMEETMIISRSNKRATIYNNGIRNRILYREEELSSGDHLMVAKNNYYWTANCKEMDFIANGEIIQVMRVRRVTEMYGFRFAEHHGSFSRL